MWWFLSCAGLSLAGWAVVSAREAFYPERRLLAPPDPLPSYTVHNLRAADGLSFDVWRLEAPSPRARILLCHGYYANRYQVLGVAERLRRRGYEALLFELRGHGSRPGPCTFGMKETGDAIAILQWAKARDPARSLPVGLLGFSLGGAVACQVARSFREVNAVVVDSVYSRLFPVLRRVVQQRYHLPAFPLTWLTWWALQLALQRRLASSDPVALAPHLRQPLFAIQGGEDGQELYQRWAGPKEQWFEATVEHVGMFARHPQEYGDRVANFFDRVFA